MELNGKIAVVTGGGRGIGAAIATVLARAGCDVAILGRDEKSLGEQQVLLSASGRRVIAERCDIRSWLEVQSAVSRISSYLGPIEILVNNAGGWEGAPLSEVSESRLAELTNTVVTGTMYMAKAVLPGMMERRSGFILTIGSTSGLPGTRDSVAASAPKAALVGMTHALRREAKDFGIRVAILHPAGVRSKPSINPPLSALTTDGRPTHISALQVAEVALFVLMQPANLLIEELTVVPVNSDV